MLSFTPIGTPCSGPPLVGRDPLEFRGSPQQAIGVDADQSGEFSRLLGGCDYGLSCGSGPGCR